MNPELPVPQSTAEADIPAGTAEASSDTGGPVIRVTQDGAERIYQDGTVEIVNY
jgi:hypothetical protein